MHREWLWQSIVAHKSIILLVVCVLSAICTLALAVCVRSLTKKVNRLTRDLHRWGLLMDKLIKSDDANVQAIASLEQALNSTYPDLKRTYHTDFLDPSAYIALRREIKSIAADLDAELSQAIDLKSIEPVSGKPKEPTPFG